MFIGILQLVNLKYPSAVLAGQEVEVVPTKVLKVDLPSRRVITVIGHKGRTLREVLKPRLNKYGFKLDLITIWGEGHPVSLDIPATNAPTRLVLTSNSEGLHIMRFTTFTNLLRFVSSLQPLTRNFCSHRPRTWRIFCLSLLRILKVSRFSITDVVIFRKCSDGRILTKK